LDYYLYVLIVLRYLETNLRNALHNTTSHLPVYNHTRWTMNRSYFRQYACLQTL